jgi:hypothetical protein
VSEPAGLDDFGGVVLGEPGSVGVAGVVEVHAFEDGLVLVFGLPLTAGRQTRRDMAERRRKAPRAPQKTKSWSWLSMTSWSRSIRNGGTWMSRISGVGT